ncbi:hypothetical protein ADJ70_02755 [Olsenella sp. oral taxon 807]|nr:hypothetical protein ADJ70_02755 [Olsenella sp. oral taxon 807]
MCGARPYDEKDSWSKQGYQEFSTPCGGKAAAVHEPKHHRQRGSQHAEHRSQRIGRTPRQLLVPTPPHFSISFMRRHLAA